MARVNTRNVCKLSAIFPPFLFTTDDAMIIGECGDMNVMEVCRYAIEGKRKIYHSRCISKRNEGPKKRMRRE